MGRAYALIFLKKPSFNELKDPHMWNIKSPWFTQMTKTYNVGVK